MKVIFALILLPFPLIPQIRFQDVTEQSGVRFTLTNGAVGEFHQMLR